MKKRATLRAKTLDQTKLAKASGGRGTCHGYYECLFCHWTSSTVFGLCGNCGRPYDPGINPKGRK